MNLFMENLSKNSHFVFEPSMETKTQWLRTRKKVRTYESVELPGLFATHAFWLDRLFFILIIVLEIWGLMNFVMVAEIHIAFTLLFFGIDVVLAGISHSGQGTICILKNDITLNKGGLLEKTTTENEKNLSIKGVQKKKEKKLKRLNFIKNLCEAGIWGLAIFKIWAFIGNYTEGINGLSLAIIVSYLVVAFLHCYSTMFFVDEVIHRYKMKKEAYRSEIEQNSIFHAKTIKNNDLELRVDFQWTPIQKLNNSSEGNTSKSQENKKNKYTDATFGNHSVKDDTLVTLGILTDEELNQLIIRQPKDLRALLALQGLKYQFTLLQSEPS
jgi:hypothetical protein